MRPTVKICGHMRVIDVRMCARHGADIIGFVVDYPRPVPWNLSAEAARELISAVPPTAESCVVTGGPPDKILRLAWETRPDYVQLHCGETLADAVYLAEALKKRGVKVIKTIFPDTPDLEKTAAQFCAAGVFALLFDPRTPDNAVSGGAADLSVYAGLRKAVSCPVILAGGINPHNAAGIVRETGAEMIDLMTGVEERPGVKDEAKVIELFGALRGL